LSLLFSESFFAKLFLIVDHAFIVTIAIVVAAVIIAIIM